CDPQTIKEAIIATAIRDGYVTAPATENNTFGNGFIDAYAAVLAVYNLGGVEGVVNDASSQPLEGALVRNPAGSQQTTTLAGGYYFLPISEGTYSLEYSKFGYVTQTIPGVSVTAGDTTEQNATLSAVPTAPLYGYVYDPDNLPLSGAQVRAVGVPIDPVSTNGAGYYTLNLPVGDNYTVRADASGFGSEQHAIVFNGTMQQDFHLSSIQVEDYESGGFSLFPWYVTGSVPWQVVSSGAYEGTYCAQSGAIADAQSSEMSVSMNVTTAASFSFYYKVSSEEGYDFLVFLIDGAQQSEWSGEIAWTQASYNLTAGHHTFTWRYTKDGNAASGSDAAWVDYVLFPPSSALPTLPTLACYDFELSAQGWVSGATGDNATTGQWERGDPEGTWNSDRPVQPEDDHTASGVNCWATGRLAGTALGTYDVDGGKTTLLSPVWNLQTNSSAWIELWSWYSNDEGGGPDEDYFVVSFSSDGGTNWVDALSTHYDWEYWRRDVFYVEDFVTLSSQVRMRVIGQDQSTGSLVEAAVDDVCLYAGTAAPPDPPQALTIIREGDDLHLYWESSPGATSYTIQRAPEAGGSYSDVATVGAGVTDWICVGCVDDGEFASFRVYSEN
ncbi:MAG: carboxypeptidase-like regulatory domain-containing protein, partial [bacterium]|nr:carboxypeptidase-like regulatory domain-containing protein [bacterium]